MVLAYILWLVNLLFLLVLRRYCHISLFSFGARPLVSGEPGNRLVKELPNLLCTISIGKDMSAIPCVGIPRQAAPNGHMLNIPFRLLEHRLKSTPVILELDSKLRVFSLNRRLTNCTSWHPRILS